MATLLVRSGVGVLYVFDDEPPERTLYPRAGVLSSRAEALRACLDETAATQVYAVDHWTKPDDRSVDLTILACDGPEVDRVILDHLVRSDQPHLLVRSWGNGVSVGPLVLPGQTSCVQCSDLIRTDVDRDWPVLLNQLVRLRTDLPPAAPAPPTLVAWAASVGTAHAVSLLVGGTPESLGCTLELGWPEMAMELRTWPPHRACGCGWVNPPEWDA